MNRQRGIADGWLILIAILAIAGACWYAYQTIDSRAYARGKTEESAYQKRDNEALRAANARIQALQTERRAIEAMHAAQVNTIAETLQRSLDNEKAKRADLERRYSAGELRMRDPGAKCPAASGGSRVPETRPGSPGSDAPAGVELSGQAAQFLFDLATSADETARRLTACQSVIRADRGGK